MDSRLDSSSSSSAWSSGSIMRNGCDVLDSADSESGSSQHSNCCLCSRSWCPCLVSTRRADSDVERSYSPVLCNSCGCGCSLHGCVRGALKSISFNVLATSTSGYCFSTTKVGDVNKSVVEGRIDVGYTPALWSFLLRHSLVPDGFRHGTFDPLYLTYLRARYFQKMKNWVRQFTQFGAHRSPISTMFA